MHPILYQMENGPLRLSTYGLMIAIAFIVGVSFLVRERKIEGKDPEVVLDLAYYLIIAAIIGSRIFYITINYKIYLNDPMAIIRSWEGGLVFYGGLIGCLIVGTWYIKKFKLNFFEIADTVIVAVPLGQVFGRLGCFFAGCCYGQHAPQIPWAITFSDPASLAPKNIPLHPTQLYASFGALMVFLILFGLKRFKHFEGQVFASYLLLYPINRVIQERFRGDFARKFLDIPGLPPIISTGDVVSFVLFVLGGYLYLRFRKRHLENLA